MRFLVGKNVLLISPQPWEHIFISKHHYAQELARAGNKVYFLEPPETTGLPRVSIEVLDDEPEICLISWRPWIPRILRFHLWPLYRRLSAIQARWLVKKVDVRFDVVWSFDLNVFPDLAAFRGTFRILHVVDPVTSRAQMAVADTADLVIGVSERILGSFCSSTSRQKTLFVNHGLSRHFLRLAHSDEVVQATMDGQLSVGYFGNLDRKVIDRGLWEQFITENREVEFHFWGPYSKAGAFPSQLASHVNVTLHGAKPKADLVEEIKRVDAFVLAYSRHESESDRSNAHKILEYLSTGKVVVTVRMDACEEIRHLVRMPLDDDDRGLPALLSETLKEIERHNSPSLCQARKQYARQFSYDNNLRRIDEWIVAHVQAGDPSRRDATARGSEHL